MHNGEVQCGTENCSSLFLLRNSPSLGHSITWGSTVILICLGAIPSCIRILLWIREFKDTGSVINSPHGAPSNVYWRNLFAEQVYHFSAVQFAQLSNIHTSWAQAEVWDETCKISGCTPTRYRQTKSFFLMINCVRILQHHTKHYEWRSQCFDPYFTGWWSPFSCKGLCEYTKYALLCTSEPREVQEQPLHSKSCNMLHSKNFWDCWTIFLW